MNSDLLRVLNPRYAAVALALTAVLALGLNVVSLNACFGGPSDLGAAEVVLNKPGITYNFTALTSLDGVTVVNEGIAAYRSHLNSKLVVMVFFDRVSISSKAPKYLVVRIQAPVKLVNTTIREYSWGANLRNVNTNLSKLRSAASNLGWSVKAAEHFDGTFTAYLVRNVNNCNITLWIEGSPKSSSANTYDLRASMKATGERDCIVNAVTTLLKEVTGEHVEMNPKLIKEHTQQKVEVGVNDAALRATLAYELKWLENIGVIKGLGSEDIAAIVKVAKEGTAGWNSRIVYANSTWLPYNEALKYIPGSALIRGCGDITGLITQANLNTPTQSTVTVTSVTTKTVTHTAGMPQQLPPNMEHQEPNTVINPWALTVAALAGIAAATTIWLIAKHKH